MSVAPLPEAGARAGPEPVADPSREPLPQPCTVEPETMCASASLGVTVAATAGHDRGDARDSDDERRTAAARDKRIAGPPAAHTTSRSSYGTHLPSASPSVLPRLSRQCGTVRTAWPSARSPRSDTRCCARSRARSRREELARARDAAVHRRPRRDDARRRRRRPRRDPGLRADPDLRDRGPQQPALPVQAAHPADHPRQPGADAGRRRAVRQLRGLPLGPEPARHGEAQRPRPRPGVGPPRQRRSTRSCTASRPAPTSTRSITCTARSSSTAPIRATFATWTEFERHHKAAFVEQVTAARRARRLVATCSSRWFSRCGLHRPGARVS